MSSVGCRVGGLGRWGTDFDRYVSGVGCFVECAVGLRQLILS